jgi:4'-phosphopantetheinyl transferase
VENNRVWFFGAKTTQVPETLTLGTQDIHLWKLSLNQPDRDSDTLQKELSADELERAGSYRFNSDRRRFVVRRSLQRRILAKYTDLCPSELCFEYNAHGRPSLVQPDGQSSVSFNASHSHELALIAVGRSPLIGIDIEQVRKIEDANSIVARFCSDEEQKRWVDIAGEDRELAFFDLWTRKEAFIKAIGRGLSMDLRHFTVSLDRDDPQLTHWPGNDCEVPNWTMCRIEAATGFGATLAVGDKPPNGAHLIRVFEF